MSYSHEKNACFLAPEPLSYSVFLPELYSLYNLHTLYFLSASYLPSSPHLSKVS